MAHIVIVEDEDSVALPVAYRLRSLGHQVSHFQDGQEACERLLQMKAPDVCLIDLMLPGMDGLDLCRRVREAHPLLSIIIVTARSEEVDRVLGLESGADDYVVKPFSLRELEARIKAALRRSAHVAPVPTGPVSVGPFHLDRDGGVVRKDDQPLSLSPKEFDLLAIFLERPGHVFSRDDLMHAVWGDDYMGESKTLDVHIRWLRIKVEEDPANPRHLVTVRGRGYRLDP